MTLRGTLGVIYKTLNRYVSEAWRALSILGIKLKHLRETGLLSAIKDMSQTWVTKAGLLCGVSWEQILGWANDGIELTRLDKIAMTLAFGTTCRLGSFVPKNAKESASFWWILPRYSRRSSRGTTLLVGIPRVKIDPERRGTVLTVKTTGNSGSSLSYMSTFLKGKLADDPLLP